MLTPSDIENLLNALASTLGDGWLWTLIAALMAMALKKADPKSQMTLDRHQKNCWAIVISISSSQQAPGCRLTLNV
jgi:hypothetical protein